MNESVQTKPRFRTLDLAYIALFAALMAACAWVSVPVPKPFVPFTLQTFAVFAAVLCLGGGRAFYAVLVYLLCGAAGLPVFSGFQGGPGILLGSTGGYLIGFLALALVFHGATVLFGDAPAVQIAACVCGLAVCYAFGTAWFLIVYAASSGAIGLMTALSWCVIPFIFPDMVKLCMAAVLAQRVRKLMK